MQRLKAVHRKSSNEFVASDRKPLNKAKNNKLLDCGHAVRYSVRGACIACGERPKP